MKEQIAKAFIEACEAELSACKPGNVHVHAAGHGMTVDDFKRSAAAAAPHLARSGARLGERVFGAAKASWDATGQNTNLGIILLCAPIAHAAEQAEAGDSLTRDRLQVQLRATLDTLGQEDADNVFAAIAFVNPGGLGDHGEHDVRKRPQISLLHGMALAAERDRIAAAYGNGFADIFGFGLDVLESARRTFGESALATSALYLGFLGEFPDSHISRKFGQSIAAEVRQEAKGVRADLYAVSPEDRLPLLMAFDTRLKERGLNPGTSADFTVATLFTDALIRL